MVLRPGLSAADTALVTPAAAVATARAISRAAGVEVGVKWVNDLYYAGKKLCGILAEAPLGADGRPEIVEEEAAIIRKIYDLFLSGKTINEIAAILTNMGVLTPAGRAKWSVSTVRSILSNEKYEKPGNEKILEEKTSQRKYENIEEQETSEQSKNTDAVRKSKSNPNVPEERNSQNANSDLPPKTTKDIIYKITRQELAGLPRKEWKLANNHFLLHGYYNYHHLVSFEKEGKCWIGVPGLYFSGEQRAAGAFGFSQFMKPSDGELDLEEYEIEDEEHFGYWCRPVGAVIRKEVKEKEDAEDIDRRRKIHEGSDPSGEKSMED